MKTTLRAIKNHEPYSSLLKTLLSNLGKTEADNEQISLRTVLESNGLCDAVWCLRAVDGFDREKRLFAVFCSKQARRLTKNKRCLKAIKVAERYANGLATDDELAASNAAVEAMSGSDDLAVSTARAVSDAWAARAAWYAWAAGVAMADWITRDTWAASAARAAGVYIDPLIIERDQKTEFIRMLNCIESGEVYTISF